MILFLVYENNSVLMVLLFVQMFNLHLTKNEKIIWMLAN